VETGTIQEHFIELDVGEFLGDLTTDIQEETISQLHDVGLVDSSDTIAADGLSIGEGITGHTFGSFLGDQLDGLDHTIDNFVFDTRVFTFGVFTDQDSVNVFVRGLVTSNGATGTDVGVEVEGTT
jgi:hypothetical protein